MMTTLRCLLSGALLAGTYAPVLADKPLHLPPHLKGKVVVLKAGEEGYDKADLASAVKPPGEGGLIDGQGVVIRLTTDLPIYRMWNGPDKKDARGNTNRLGQWWAFDAPHGKQEDYRRDYEICNNAWNDLTWVAKCTLKKGAIVAIGPGNSVSAKTCGDLSGKESYPANKRDWQVWIPKAWSRVGPDKDIDCPPDSSDYQADPQHISSPKKSESPASQGAPQGTPK